MRFLSLLVGLAGILVIAVALVGRFHGPPTVTIFGIRSAATHVLLVGDSFLLIAIFLGLRRVGR